PLTAGQHVLRLSFAHGEFNLGRMTFARTSDLPYSIPVADAGIDIKVLLPVSSVQLNGSASIETAGKTLSYLWKQVYGPSIATISSLTVAQPTVSNLREGMYKFQLQVTNTDSRFDTDEVLVMVTSTANV